ncbi:carbohydrate ABC transporter permease [Halobellus ordinarius]|uniref:carbohydrate ABC transporter permease n=1 Tax=Halobellus ordinarius TaxID=3075120 RepID=UPI00288052BB|nr:sugar ABC transporter permease [Halobellus sp. ZY16]
MSEIYQSRWKAALLLLPTLSASVAFLYYPAIETFRLSLYKTVAAGARQQYVGLENFEWLLTSGRYQYSFLITLAFAVVVVVGSLAIALYLSYLIYQIEFAKSFYLISGILSYSFSFAIVATIMLFLLHPTVGIFTFALEAATGIRLEWLSNDLQALAVVSGTTILKMIGYNVIFLVGAFSSIPATIDETAKLDGIGHLKLLTRVYIPLVSPTIGFLVIMNTVYAFFLPFPVIDIMTSGGPGNTTTVLIYELYQTAFSSSQMGLAAAQSLILFVLVGGLMIVQLIMSDRYAHYGGG